MGGKTMRLRRNGTCVVCAVDLPSGMAAVWYADEKVVRCEPCAASLVASNHPALSDTPQAEGLDHQLDRQILLQHADQAGDTLVLRA